jgi:hypothetical protein
VVRLHPKLGTAFQETSTKHETSSLWHAVHQFCIICMVVSESVATGAVGCGSGNQDVLY